MVTCKSKNVYFAMDTTSGYNTDMKIMDNIQKKLENAGFTVHRIHEPENGSNNGRGPNAMANQYSYMGRKNIKNSIVFNLMNGVDPSNIVEAYQSSSNRGDGFWYSQRYLKPLGNVAVLGWFYGACDAVHPGGSCYEKGIRPSETYLKRFYNPKQKMDENGVLCLCEKNDYNGDKVAEAFIKLVKENMGEATDESTTDTTSDTTVLPATETTVTTLTEQTVTEVYSNAYYQEILTATTDKQGSFNIPLSLPYAGKYNVNITFAGSKYHEYSTHTVSIDHPSGTKFQPKLLQTTTISKYSDGSTNSVVNGSTEGFPHILTIVKKRTYQNGVLENETSTMYNNDDVALPSTFEPSSGDTSQVTPVVDDPNKKDPFNQYVEVNSDGSPKVTSMKHSNCTFKMVDLTRSYTLTKEQYKAVMDRDSKSLQLCNYVESKYTAFLSQETPNEYQVIHRERWNAVEESIYYYLVKGDGKKYTLDSPDWPEKIVIDFANHKTTLGGSTIDWKAEKCTYWFVADNQDLGYTCGPTSSSVCTQVLHKYYSERYMQSLIHAVSGGGSAPSAHQSAFKNLGFTAEIYSSMSEAADWLRQHKPCVFHMDNHYIALADISDNKNTSSSLKLNCSNIHLSNGSNGSNVSTLQQILKNKGYYSGEINGTFDTTLENSVKSYQRANGLTVDGWVGPVTCRSLNGVNSGGSKILVCNSIQSDGDYGPLSGWRSYSILDNKIYGTAVKVGLNWSISEEEKNTILNFYKSMGGAWEKKPNLNESVRMYYLKS